MGRNEFAELLRELRVQSHLTQFEVAEKLQYATPQYVSNWERGISTPPVAHLKTLAKIFKYDDELLFEKFLQEEIRVITEDFKKQFTRKGRWNP
ncbi:XRE family transcriptional regulator [Bdellovibrio sp. NC01]|nr:XRE family transcriptional regulator [Bdellovibrio sp. NC01]